MHFDHIGWITVNINDFERFWVDILGFKCVKESVAKREMIDFLFGVDKDVIIKRYRHSDIAVDIEIHHFPDNDTTETPFSRTGINHVCLHVPSKKDFVESLPSDVTIKCYDNPGGWTNIFIKDYEGNWIELRETM